MSFYVGKFTALSLFVGFIVSITYTKASRRLVNTSNLNFIFLLRHLAHLAVMTIKENTPKSGVLFILRNNLTKLPTGK